MKFCLAELDNFNVFLQMADINADLTWMEVSTMNVMACFEIKVSKMLAASNEKA